MSKQKKKPFERGEIRVLSVAEEKAVIEAWDRSEKKVQLHAHNEALEYGLKHRIGLNPNRSDIT